MILYLSALEAGYLSHWKPSFLSSDLIPLLYQKREKWLLKNAESTGDFQIFLCRIFVGIQMIFYSALRALGWSISIPDITARKDSGPLTASWAIDSRRGQTSAYRSNEAVRFLEQGFDPVLSSSAEKEESTGRQIHLKLVLNNGTEFVNGFPHNRCSHRQCRSSQVRRCHLT